LEEKKILQSWKEIASYLGRAERTCRRWEKEFGLPVHRMDGSPRASVFAYKGELDRWLDRLLHEKKISSRIPFFLSKRKFVIVLSISILFVSILTVVTWKILSTKTGVSSSSSKPSLAIIYSSNSRGESISSSTPGGVSPEGRLLSFVDWSTQRGELAVMEIATGKRRRLTHKPLEDESWYNVDHSIFSPDGKKLAFTRWNDNGTFDFRIINVDGSGQRVLLNGLDVHAFIPNDWTNDGKYILGLLQENDKTNNIAFVSAIDGSFRIIREFDKSSPGILTLSSDGRWIAYDFPQGEKSDKRNIFLLSEDGSREIPLLKHPADDRLLGWTPDDDWILFSSDRSFPNGNAVGVPFQCDD